MTVRILYAISSLHRGGAERQLVELIRGIDRARYEPRLALCDTTDQFGYDLGVGEVIDLRSPGGSTPMTLARLVSTLRTVQPAITHTYGGLLNIYGRMAVRATGIGLAVSAVRNGKPPTRDLMHEALTWRMTDAIIANSVGIRDVLSARAGIPPERVDVVENGVDTLHFVPVSPVERDAVRSQWDLHGRVLVLPARMTPEKNHVGVVRALGVLRSRGALPADVSVRFAGRAASRESDEAIRRALEESGAGDRVRFEGRVDDIGSLLGAADAVILPSTHEGMPNAVMEALACGTSVIVSPPANRDGLVRDGVEGIVLHGTDVGALVEGLSRWITLTPAARAAMGIRARQRAESYALPRMIDRTCNVYDRLITQRGFRPRSS